MRRYLASVILVGWGTASVAGPIDVDPEDLQPGLVAEYRSLVDGEARLARIDKKPAFYLGRSSPHPRLPAGPFEVAWSGMIFLKEETSYSFAAYVCGEVTVAIDGEIALRGKGSDDNSYLLSDHVFKRSFGLYRIEVTYRSLPNTPARLQLWWEGENFSREPLPAWQLFHLVKKLPASVLEQQQVDRGRELAADSGCARCHRSAFPGIEEPPPGPSLTHLGRRVSRAWLMHWLAEPTKIHEQTRMPALFTNDRNGFVERWLITDYLLGGEIRSTTQKLKGDHRSGRLTFLKVGCIACHASPEKDKVRKPGQIVFAGLKDRFDTSTLAEFLTNPHSRYPDGRMPALPLSKQEAIDVAEYLLLWSKASVGDKIDGAPPTARERNEMLSRLRVRRASDLGAALVRDKGCTQCHPGLDRLKPRNVAIRNADAGCLDDDSLPRFHLSPKEKQSLKRFLAIARRESHPSPFFARQKLVDRFGCLRCHQRDSETPPPLEQAGSTVAGAFLQYVPFQRTPKLTDAHQKYELAYLRRAIREGVEGLRPARYSYRMPRFGQHADAVVQALAEADGELPTGPLPKPRGKIDPTLGTQVGPNLAGFQGYSCVSCHVWKGQMLSSPDPGAVGTDLTKVKGRIRRDWFERFLENPRRFHPGTPMPAVFIKGKKATLTSILDGDPNRQKEALWAFLQLGSSAPSPKPLPPLPVPLSGSEPIVAQIPIRQSDGTYIESISILYPSHDLLVYDLAAGGLQQVYIGAQIGREVQGRLRRFLIVGRPVGTGFLHRPVLQLRTATKTERIKELHLHYYDRLPDGVRIRHRVLFESGAIDIAETLRLSKRELVREYQSNGIPKDCRLLVSTATPCPTDFKVAVGRAEVEREKSVLSASLQANEKNQAEWVLRYSLPEAEKPPPVHVRALPITDPKEGSLERPGYRAIAYPRPKTAAGDDLIMPSALAIDPRTGRVFIASMKMGEIFVLDDPTGDGKKARFLNYANGLFQIPYAMLAEKDALYVLHRRNLTRITDTDNDGKADRFERVLHLQHGIAETYDYAYGLVRDKQGRFVFSYAPHANHHLPGSGAALRLESKDQPREIAFGFRNPLGWTVGNDGEIFFTDNQGEWVATNKLCHLQEGKFYGYPNPAQKQHALKPFAKTSLWIPYDWARSINGVTFNNTGGKFGPFEGQFFLAELMFGGAIIRAQLEKINGQYQGACFPFWGKGLLGPVVLAFDPQGRLFVGSITEPGWMAQPDRGALYRIDFTGKVPFEMKSIHVRPSGFRIVFTKAVDRKTASAVASFQIRHHRYEYTGAYGSPELDRSTLAIKSVRIDRDGCSVDLVTAPLLKDRVYMITAGGVLSVEGEQLVHSTGAYTLNEIPKE